LWIITACDLFNLTLRPGLIIAQTSDDSLFANSAPWTGPLQIYNEPSFEKPTVGLHPPNQAAPGSG